MKPDVDCVWYIFFSPIAKKRNAVTEFVLSSAVYEAQPLNLSVCAGVKSCMCYIFLCEYMRACAERGCLCLCLLALN